MKIQKPQKLENLEEKELENWDLGDVRIVLKKIVDNKTKWKIEGKDKKSASKLKTNVLKSGWRKQKNRIQ